MAKAKLSSKQFFLLVSLSSTLLIMLFVVFTGVIDTPTRTTSDASGVSGANLNACTSLLLDGHLEYGGGVKLYNGDGYTGGDRVLCASFYGYDNIAHDIVDNLNKKDIDNPTIYDDIWGQFQLKTESLKLRAFQGCLVKVFLYSEYDAPNYALIDSYEINRIGKTTHNKSIELPKSQDNKAKSIKLRIKCKG